MQTYNPTMLHEVKYTQHVSVKKRFSLTIHEQPGAADPDIDSVPGVYEVTIGEFFWEAVGQWTPFLDSQKRWRVVISNVNPYYDGVTQVNDSIILRMAAIQAPAVAWQQNSVQVSTLEFWAESREDSGNIVSP